jgi:hypothetical protein
MRLVLALIASLGLAACITPASEESLALPKFEMTEYGWQAVAWTGAAARPGRLEEGEVFASVEAMVAAARLYGTDIDVEVDSRLRRLRVTMVATGYRDDAISAEQVRVAAQKVAQGYRITDLDRLHQCRRHLDEPLWTSAPCP